MPRSSELPAAICELPCISEPRIGKMPMAARPCAAYYLRIKYYQVNNNF